jgi:hypothetical protein
MTARIGVERVRTFKRNACALSSGFCNDTTGPWSARQDAEEKEQRQANEAIWRSELAAPNSTDEKPSSGVISKARSQTARPAHRTIRSQPRSRGNYAYFSRPTDTISVAGVIPLGNAVTFEARVWITGTASEGTGVIFNEWAYGQDDKQFGATATLIGANVFPLPFADNPSHADTTGRLHDVVYEYDGAQESLYFDGHLVASQAVSGNIANDPNAISTVGAIFRDNIISPSFLGYIDTLRISDIARYSGNSYVPLAGDLKSDSHTQLLYNFDEPAGSTTIPDLSGHGHTGTLGVGFQGATSPILGISRIRDELH